MRTAFLIGRVAIAVPTRVAPPTDPWAGFDATLKFYRPVRSSAEPMSVNSPAIHLQNRQWFRYWPSTAESPPFSAARDSGWRLALERGNWCGTRSAGWDELQVVAEVDGGRSCRTGTVSPSSTMALSIGWPPFSVRSGESRLGVPGVSRFGDGAQTFEVNARWRWALAKATS